MQTINERVFDLLEKGNINWSVTKQQLSAPEGFEVPKAFGTYAGTKYLGTVGTQYSTLQNSELTEIFVRALDKIGLEGETRAGHLFGRGKIYLQARLKDHHVAKDTVNRWLTALNSHDGTSSVGFGSTNTVVVCKNTFYLASKDLKKVRHSGEVADRVEVVANNLVRSMTQEQGMMNSFDTMAQEMLTKETIGDVIDLIFGVNVDSEVRDLSTRKQNQLTSFGNTLASEVESHGKTVWGLFNAVTYYTNHVAPGKGMDKLEYVMGRRGADINRSAYQMLTQKLTTSLV